MSIGSELIVGLVSGVISPVVFNFYQEWKREKNWAAPRKKLLKEKLTSAKGEGWVSLERLRILTGTSEEECRSLLIELNARGGRMKSKKEAWALISKQPLTKTGDNLEVAE